jgi:hypothetical protein
MGDFTVAAEYVDTDSEDGDDLTAFMVMGNYSFGDAGLTLRYTDAEYGGDDFKKYTISPSYVFSDNVAGLLEASFVEDGGEDYTELAAEVIFTF